MGYMNTEKPPEKWSGSFFKSFVERLRTALNYLDDSNFPDGLSGFVLKDKSVPTSALANVEFQHNIINLATVYTSTSTTLTNVGGYLMWDTIWGDDVELKFEVVGGIANSSAVATFELHGAGGLLASITSTSGTIELLRSAKFAPPTVGQTLLVKVKTSNATYGVNLLSARLIILIK